MYSELSLKKACDSKLKGLTKLGREEKYTFSSTANYTLIPGVCANKMLKREQD